MSALNDSSIGRHSRQRRPTSSTTARTGASAGPARVEPGRHSRRDRVDAVGLDLDLADRRDAVRVGSAARRAVSITAANASIGSLRSAMRVVPAWLACPQQVQPPSPVRPDRGTDADRHDRGRPAPGPARRAARRRRRPGAAPRRPARPGPGRGRPRSSPRPCSTPSASVRPRARSGARAPVMQPRTSAGHAEPRTLLVDEVDHPDRPGRHETAVLQGIDGRQRGDHAQRPVVGTAVGDRVEVGAGDDAGVVPPAARRRGRPTRPTGCRPGRWSGPGRVRCLRGEPLPQRGVFGGPGEPPVAPAASVAADRLQRRPERLKAHRR